MISQNRILWLPGDPEIEERADVWDDNASESRGAAGIKVTPDTALACTIVLGCTRVLAESVAGLPLHVYRRNGAGKEIARDHPLYKLLHTAPNSWQTSFEWREQLMLHLCLWGNAYSEIVAGSAGFATELIPLHPSRMRPERLPNGKVRYQYREPDGRETPYEQDRIMHLRWMSNDGLNGLVPVTLAKDAIALARACEIHGSKWFANGARPGFVLSSDNEIKPETALSIRDQWERVHAGAQNAYRTAVLGGGMKPYPLDGASNQESQFLESRRFQTEEICRVFRVPPHLVGDLSRASFSNIEQQSIDFVQHTLLSWLRRFESAFARDLLVDPDMFAEFDTRGMLRGDASARAAYYQTLWNLGVASINEIRSWESLDPVEDGDTRFVQLNMQTLAHAVAAGSETQPPADAAEAQPANQPAEPSADVSGLLAVLEQVGAGSVTPEAAVAILGSVYPAMPATTAKAIVAGVVSGGQSPPDGSAPPAPGPSGGNAPPDATGAPVAPPAKPAPVSAPPATGKPSGRAWCATGKGGGQDNSCSPHDGDGSGGSSVGDDVARITAPGTARDAESQAEVVKTKAGEVPVISRSDVDASEYIDEVEEDGSSRGLSVDIEDAAQLQEDTGLDVEEEIGAVSAYTGGGYVYFTESGSDNGDTYSDDDFDEHASPYGAITSEAADDIILEKDKELDEKWQNLDHDAEILGYSEMSGEDKVDAMRQWYDDQRAGIMEEVDRMRDAARADAINEMTRVLEAGVASSTLGCCLQLYRGIRVGDDKINAMIEDGYVTHSGLNSWTTSRGTAKDFSGGASFNKGLILVTRNPRVGWVNGDNEGGLSESEVVRPPSRMKILKVVKTKTKTFMYVDEDEDYKNA